MWQSFTYGGRMINWICAYYSILLGRCVILSIPLILCILVLRSTALRRHILGRVVVWSSLVVLPFMGKLHVFYENRIFFRATWWWTALCSTAPYVNWIYMGGVAIMAVILFARNRRLCHAIRKFPTTQIGDAKVYVSPAAVTPFTMGLIRQRIVVPKVLLETLGEEEQELIILHEQTHIRAGHLWMYAVWNVLRCLLWINPFFSIGMKWFRNDLEDWCDVLCIQRAHMDASEYGNLILKSIQLLQGKEKTRALYATFTGERQFRDLKSRMQKIAGFQRIQRGSAVVAALLTVLLSVGGIVAVKEISYPRYEEYPAISMHSEDGKRTLIPDSEESRAAVKIEADRLVIDTEKMNALRDKYHVTEDYFFLFFGGIISKMPGVGGGGNGVFVEYDATCNPLIVPYVDNDDIWFRIFKYI